MVDLNDIIKEIEAEIELYRKQENENRLKREALEQFLAKIKQSNNKQEESPIVETTVARASTQTPTKNKVPKAKAKREMINTKAELSEHILYIIEDGKPWQLSLIRKHLVERLGRDVAHSSLRDAIKSLESDGQITKHQLGIYALANNAL